MPVVRGDVRDKDTGEALPWTLVFIGDNRCNTDDRGCFEFVVPRGTYTCGMRHSHYEPLTQQDVEVNEDVDLELRPIRARL